MRIPVDVTKRSENIVVICPVCKNSLPSTMTKPNTTIWFCSKCDVSYETTTSGIILRSFKNSDDITVNILGEAHGRKGANDN